MMKEPDSVMVHTGQMLDDRPIMEGWDSMMADTGQMMESGSGKEDEAGLQENQDGKRQVYRAFSFYLPLTLNSEIRCQSTLNSVSECWITIREDKDSNGLPGLDTGTRH